ncbi:DUF1361 domain-containing protein [Hymenobacter persicinus]|uniref:DUF1361 domain-containing protein n=1 Tax=Hymenobacter persicinus TaxID=2025506 RepID=A0A4Q5LGA1_9BACT|nr:DUF1361 domain-containing protein [Hymenobacter persicinus]RYU82417.1 DUF1361 domain-containing protein [Hymenobacter persicinus]
MPVPLPLLSFDYMRRRLGLLLLFGASMALSVALLAFRIYLTHQVTYVFLLWNLFLAIVPFGMSTMLGLLARPAPPRVLLPLAAVWLVFFPNAPYIVTDFVHLNTWPEVPVWYDLTLILSFAWNGLMLGFCSLQEMQRLFTRAYGLLWGWVFVGTALLLGSLGVYFGRFLRYNSWNVVSNPVALAQDLLARFLHPFAYPGTYGVTLLLTAFLLLGYLTVRQLGHFARE